MMSRKSFNSAFGGRWVKVDFKMDHYRSLFIYFRLFNTVDCRKMSNNFFADDWILTLDLW